MCFIQSVAHLTMSGPGGRRAVRTVAAPASGTGLCGCDPRTYLVLGRAAVAPADALGAYPERDAHGRVLPVDAERRLGAWHADGATVLRRAPGGVRVEARRDWHGAHPPLVVLTDRRIVLHGGRDDDAAHLALERLMRVRADLRRRHGGVALDLLLHCRASGAAAVLEVVLELPRRRAAALVDATASAHRARWAGCALPRHVAAAIAGARPRRVARELRYDAVVHMPLGVADAIRGPGASADVPQRTRARWRERAQAAWAG